MAEFLNTAVVEPHNIIVYIFLCNMLTSKKQLGDKNQHSDSLGGGGGVCGGGEGWFSSELRIMGTRVQCSNTILPSPFRLELQ